MENVSEVRSDSNVSDIPRSTSTSVALPPTVADLIEQKKTRKSRTLNDMIDDVHLHLWENPEYRSFLDAVHREDAVEGDLFCDDIRASEMIREQARKEGNRYVAEKNLATIRKSLLVVLRRYGISRRERRET